MLLWGRCGVRVICAVVSLKPSEKKDPGDGSKSRRWKAWAWIYLCIDDLLLFFSIAIFDIFELSLNG